MSHSNDLERSSSHKGGKKQFANMSAHKNGLVLGRYQVNEKDVLGQGMLSRAYKAVDTKTSREVALKVFAKDVDDKGEEWRKRKFQHGIEVFRGLFGLHDKTSEEDGNTSDDSFAPTGPSRVMEAFKALSSGALGDPQQSFVRVLDFSRDVDGNVGADPNDGQFYMVLELGQCTLDSWIACRQEKGAGLSTDELRDLAFNLTQIVLHLHARGLVHLDLKPDNIMWFPRDQRWKLIDFDGALDRGIKLTENTEVSYTPMYCPPELAKALCERKEPRVSRLMDIWSIGLIVAELLLLEPQMEQKWREIEDPDLFMQYLADAKNELPEIPDMLKDIEPELYDLLQNKMMVRDPRRRSNIGSVFMHTFFARCREAELEEIKKQADREQRRKAKAQEEAPAPLPVAELGHPTEAQQDGDAVVPIVRRSILMQLDEMALETGRTASVRGSNRRISKRQSVGFEASRAVLEIRNGCASLPLATSNGKLKRASVIGADLCTEARMVQKAFTEEPRKPPKHSLMGGAFEDVRPSKTQGTRSSLSQACVLQ